MALNDNNNSSGENDDPLRFPIAKNRFGTMWISEGDDEFYFSIKVEVPFIGEENFSMSGTDRSQSLVNQIGETWKRDAEKEENGGGQ